MSRPITGRHDRPFCMLVAAVCSLFLAQAYGQRHYAIDPAIGIQELRTHEFDIQQIFPVAGGKLLVVGGFDYVDDIRRTGGLVRLDSAGHLDPTFNPPAFAFVTGAAIVSTGEIWVLGSVDGVSFKVVKLTSDGSLISGVTTNEVVPYAGLAPAADGGLYVIDRSGGQVTRYTSDAKAKDGFSPISLGTFIDGWALSPLGDIALTTVQPWGYEVLVFSAAGILEPSVGVPADFIIYSIAYDGVGRMLLGGAGIGQPEPILLRLLQSGELDVGFNGTIPNIYGSIESIRLMPDGRVVTTGSNGNRRGVMEFSANGAFERLVDATSASGQPAGSIYTFPVNLSEYVVTGIFDVVGGIQRNRLAKVEFGGGVSPNFTPSVEAVAQVNSVVRSTNGDILFGGYFTRIGQTSVENLAGLSSTGSVDASFPRIQWATNSIIPTQDGGVLVLGAFEPFPGTTTSGLVKLRADHSIDTNFLAGTSLGGVDCALTLSDGSILLGGQFNDITVASLLTRVTPQGTIDPTFFNQSPANGWQTISAVAAQPAGGFLIAGTFTEFQGESRASLARVTNNGLVDRAFVPEAALLPGGWPRNMSVLPDGRFYLLGHQVSSPQSWLSMMRFAADGTLDHSFVSPFETVLSYCLAPDGNMYVAGINPPALLGQSVSLVRVLANGQIDPNFVFSLDGSTTALLLAPDGSLLVGGRFTEINGQHREGLARIVPVPLSVTIDGPTSQNVALRGSITLSARAVSAGGPVSYEWYHDGELIRGAVSDKLELSRVTPKDSGEYKVAATAAGETSLSPPIILNVSKGANVH